jgi:hypothetical protein
MAAGQGFKTFTTGEVLTAADTNGYLMQGVLVFADAAARTAAIASPQEGQTSYLKDTDVIQVYSGSAWVTKSGSSPLTTKGDLYTYSTTDARLGVGSNGQVLKANSSASTGLEWGDAGAAGASYSLINTGGTALTGAGTVTVSGISGMNSIFVRIDNVSSASTDSTISMRINTDSGSNYTYNGLRIVGANSAAYTNTAAESGVSLTSYVICRLSGNAGSSSYAGCWINGANSSGLKFISSVAGVDSVSDGGSRNYVLQGLYAGTSTISSISLISSVGNLDAGTVYVYGSAG